MTNDQKQLIEQIAMKSCRFYHPLDSRIGEPTYAFDPRALTTFAKMLLERLPAEVQPYQESLDQCSQIMRQAEQLLEECAAALGADKLELAMAINEFLGTNE